jgi:hypothetical protein
MEPLPSIPIIKSLAGGSICVVVVAGVGVPGFATLGALA